MAVEVTSDSLAQPSEDTIGDFLQEHHIVLKMLCVGSTSVGHGLVCSAALL